MAKTYTAQEMREEAKCFELIGGSGAIPAMLRQAADLMEREEKREKKYEYAVKWDDGCIEKFHTDYVPSKDEILDVNKVLRREVGEWEEVRDGE